eukprot:366028-Chlamydomonas_euryale.AAC.5
MDRKKGMLIGEKGVQYGLQLRRGPGSAAASAKPAPPRPKPANVFGAESDSDEDVGAQVARQADKKRAAAKVQIEQGYAQPQRASRVADLTHAANAIAGRVGSRVVCQYLGCRQNQHMYIAHAHTCTTTHACTCVFMPATQCMHSHVQQVYEDALAQDASVFDYDGVYDSMQEQKVQPKQQEKIERKSRCESKPAQI